MAEGWTRVEEAPAGWKRVEAIPGMEKLGALPKAGQAPAIPPRLDNTTPDPRGLIRRTIDRDIDAAAAIAGGGSRAIHAKNADEAAGGLHDVASGAMILGEPLAGAALGGAAGGGAMLRTAAGLAGGAGGAHLSSAAAKALGATENEAALAGDVGGLVAGGATAKVASPANAATTGQALARAARGLGEAIPDVIESLPVVKALKRFEPVAAGVKEAIDARRRSDNGGLTPAQQAILDRFMAANPQPTLADVADLAPEDLTPAPPPPPIPEVQLRPEIQALLEEATKPQAPAPAKAERVPLWQRPGAAAPSQMVSLADLAQRTPEDYRAMAADLMAQKRAARVAARPNDAPAVIERVKAMAEAPEAVAEEPKAPPSATVSLADVARDPMAARRSALRDDKVNKVAEHLAKNGISPDDVHLISPRQWSAVAQAAGVNDLTPAQIELVKQQFGGATPKRALQPGPNAFNPSERGSWKLHPDPEQQGEIDDSNVDKLRAAYRRGDPIPPIVAYDMGGGDARIIEGHHRYEAAQAEGVKPEVVVIPKSQYESSRAEGDTREDIEFTAQSAWRKARRGQ